MFERTHTLWWQFEHSSNRQQWTIHSCTYRLHHCVYLKIGNHFISHSKNVAQMTWQRTITDWKMRAKMARKKNMLCNYYEAVLGEKRKVNNGYLFHGCGKRFPHFNGLFARVLCSVLFPPNLRKSSGLNGQENCHSRLNAEVLKRQG